MKRININTPKKFGSTTKKSSEKTRTPRPTKTEDDDNVPFKIRTIKEIFGEDYLPSANGRFGRSPAVSLPTIPNGEPPLRIYTKEEIFRTFHNDEIKKNPARSVKNPAQPLRIDDTVFKKKTIQEIFGDKFILSTKKPDIPKIVIEEPDQERPSKMRKTDHLTARKRLFPEAAIHSTKLPQPKSNSKIGKKRKSTDCDDDINDIRVLSAKSDRKTVVPRRFMRKETKTPGESSKKAPKGIQTPGKSHKKVPPRQNQTPKSKTPLVQKFGGRTSSDSDIEFQENERHTLQESPLTEMCKMMTENHITSPNISNTSELGVGLKVVQEEYNKKLNSFLQEQQKQLNEFLTQLNNEHKMKVDKLLQTVTKSEDKENLTPKRRSTRIQALKNINSPTDTASGVFVSPKLIEFGNLRTLTLKKNLSKQIQMSNVSIGKKGYYDKLANDPKLNSSGQSFVDCTPSGKKIFSSILRDQCHLLEQDTPAKSKN